jgi:exodeoxyribonuclease VII large subunit
LRAVVDRRRGALAECSGALRPAVLRAMIARKAEALGRRSDRLSPRTLERDLNDRKAKLAEVSRRFSEAGQRQIRGWKDEIAQLDRLRETLGYQATLDRGYAVVWGDGKVVTRAADARKAAEVEIQFADQRISLTSKPTRKAAKPEKPKPEQGSLF